MKTFRKILLATAATTLTIAPIASVISCGSSTNPQTKASQEQLNNITHDMVQKAIEGQLKPVPTKNITKSKPTIKDVTLNTINVHIVLSN